LRPTRTQTPPIQNRQTPKRRKRLRPASRNTKKKEGDVTQEKAQQIALKRAKGTVENSELKTEKGRGVYEFQIKQAKGQMRDVWVDQKTGKVVRNVLEKKK
jgi:uncharacterized membrane protein YkoI